MNMQVNTVISDFLLIDLFKNLYYFIIFIKNKNYNLFFTLTIPVHSISDGGGASLTLSKFSFI